ncbi:MAG TPA: PQQ-dependent sugar dehydrogenase, partial [Dehalococcoidia bacterium]|nr:PQQ-dependent sugar dehydrogenase [Dehalococcoidia bacterium]
MLGFEMLPGSEDEALVLTQHGEIWRVPLGDGEAERVADLSERIIQDPGFEEGLLGIAFSPDFATDNTLYLYFSAGEPRRTVLSRFHIAPDGTLDLGSEEVLLEVAQP